ncbi:hypothetical protein [Alcaligenes sp. WGS1538]|uniref:hypothetical protein n=1 Tax=Alcaligenes sp. WGS1538 TaxID=3366811 RepID=UPI00372CF2D5
MAIVALSLPPGMNVQPELERQDLGFCPLGTVGNLAFQPEQGGTARASRAGVMLSNLRRSLANLLNDLTACFNGAPGQARASRKYVGQAHAGSHYIGNLLGRLTAPAHAQEGRAATARALEQLSELSKGDLSKLRGWQYCVAIYLEELTAADLKALHGGVLGDQDARQEMLNQIPSEQARRLAERVLSEISAHMWLRAAQETLGEFADGLAVSDRPGQMTSLINFGKSLDRVNAAGKDGTELDGRGDLDFCLQSLPKRQLHYLLLSKLQRKPGEGGLDDIRALVSGWYGDNPERQLTLAALDRLCAALERWMHAYKSERAQLVKG